MPRPRHPASLAARLAPPLAAVLAIAVLARFQVDPAAAAESGYLALAVGLVLVAAAAVAPRPSAETLGGALLATAAVFTLPPGPARGAVAVAVAAGALAVAAVRWLPLRDRLDGAAGADRSEDPGLPAVPVLASAFGLQALLRAEQLLAPGSVLRALVLFVAFPLAGGLAVLALTRLQGRRRALLAAVAVLLLGPGFRPATVAALVTLAAGSWLLARGPVAPGLLPSAFGRAIRGLGGRSLSAVRLGIRVAAAAALLAPFAWDPAIAAACLVAGVAAAVPAAGVARRWLPPLLATAVLGIALGAGELLPVRPLAEVVPLASLVVLAVPALALPARDRAPLAIAALLLALAAARGVTVEGALAPAAGLAALAVPRRGPVPAVQGAWSAVLLGAASVLAAYPWLRPEPLRQALGLLGLEPGWPGALAAVAAVALVAGVAALAARRAEPGREERAAARAAAVAAFILALAHLPAAGATPIGGSGTVLRTDRPARTLPGGGETVHAVVLDSSLANAAALPRGTPVATLRLRESGRADRVWTLRVGDETGEWAAGRPDLRAERVPSPAAWTSWVADGEFFGRRYRSVHRLVEPAAPDELELLLRSDLPEDVELTVFHLELRP